MGTAAAGRPPADRARGVAGTPAAAPPADRGAAAALGRSERGLAGERVVLEGAADAGIRTELGDARVEAHLAHLAGVAALERGLLLSSQLVRGERRVRVALELLAERLVRARPLDDLGQILLRHYGPPYA